MTTARDLLRTRLEPGAPVAKAVTTGTTASPAFPSPPQETEKAPRLAELLQLGQSRPSAQFETEPETEPVGPDVLKQTGVSGADPVDPVKELEPMAASVDKQAAAEEITAQPTPSGDPRGLDWYLRNRVNASPASTPSPREPELLGYDNMPSHGTSPPAEVEEHEPASPREEEKAEVLFSYIDEGSAAKHEPDSPGSHSRGWLRRLAMVLVLLVACGAAYLRTPRSFWHKNPKEMTAYVARAVHGWLNPQPMTTPQAPATHENFGRAGDEYKLPVAENIPDATTDPSQIQVLPVIDPTAKQTNGTSTNQASPDNNSASQPDAGSVPIPQVQAGEAEAPQPATTPSQPVAEPPHNASSPQADSRVTVQVAHAPIPASLANAPGPAVTPAVASTVAPKRISNVNTSGIPTSLQSQLASTTPEASGNKPVEAALPSIEPVTLPETVARSLLLDQPQPAYPQTAKGQRGTVNLQVLVGRDGTVQDAKFLQGSLAFARAAIDAVKLWRFKPYLFNGRPVSVQTIVTLTFKPSAQAAQ
jgi:periplasmic protein TonB